MENEVRAGRPRPQKRVEVHKGWHSRGYLPHFDSSETIQFITFRLADSLPKHVLQNWTDELREQVTCSTSRREKLRRKIEKYLDCGYGGCELGEEPVAEIVEQALLHFDDERYRVLSWVIMPNHIHALVEVIANYSLSQIVSSWKSYTSHEIGKLKVSSGQFWQPDYFDRFIRDEPHFHRAVAYIENNPVKAGLCKRPEDWPYGSARFNLRS